MFPINLATKIKHDLKAYYKTIELIVYLIMCLLKFGVSNAVVKCWTRPFIHKGTVGKNAFH